MRRPPIVLLVLCAVLCGRDLSAQDRWSSTSWVDDLNFASANAIIGGLTAGVASRLRGGSFTDAFAGGALGGGVTYVGKRISAARFDGAGLLGRQIGAVGVSMTRNASSSSGLLDSLVVPLGPVRATVSPSRWRRPSVRLDASETYWLLYGLAEDRLTLDAGRSLSAGAPVFTTEADLRSGGPVNGMFVGGTIVMTHRARADLEDVFAHERVHVMQYDFLKHAIGYPLEDWLRTTVGIADSGIATRFLVGYAHMPLRYLLIGPWPRSSRMTEVEAEFLEAR